MVNLRIKSVTAVSSTEIVATFTENLATDLSTENVIITSQTPNVPDPEIVSFKITADSIELKVLPLSPLAAYFITFKSSSVRFRNINSTSFLIEDGKTNAVLLLGPEDSDNIIYNNFINYFRDNIYNLDDGTVVSDFLKILANHISKALYDVRQLKNENYISKNIIDEQKTRGSGAFDRLNEEGAYEILRVGKTATGYDANDKVYYSQFPSSLTSLRKQDINSEKITINSTDIVGSFNINTFTLNVNKKNVIKLNKLVFYYNFILPNGSSSFEYNINQYGYLIKDARYDVDYGFGYDTLESNQFRISDKVLADPNFSLNSIDYVSVSYSYKNLGRIVNPTTVAVTKDVSVTREVIEPLLNIFNLKHFPIIDSSGNVITTGGVDFLDPSAYPSLSKKHPAFKSEIPFSYELLPSKVGEYSVDYSSGTVYVFGEDSKNQGTGSFPPLASYRYRFTYQPLIDYVYDADEADLVGIVGRELIGNEADVQFDFQDVLIPGADYKANIHKEILSERIENRIYPTVNALKVKNSPVTNVFKIYNETQGQIYTASRWLNDTVYFTFTTEPNIENFSGERVSFETVLNEKMFVAQETVSANLYTIFKIELKNSNIIAGTEDSIGSSFNTSVTLSDGNVFKREIYFDPTISSDLNINRLTVGDYCIDYVNGIVWVAVEEQGYDIGSISYKRSYITPTNSHVLAPLDIYFRRSLLQPKDKTFSFKDFGEGFILPESFERSDEFCLNGSIDYPYYLVGGTVGAFIDTVFTAGVSNNIKFVRALFERDDLLNNPVPINFFDAATFVDKTLNCSSKTITSVQIVEQQGLDFYISAGIDLNYLSSNISIDFQVIRLTDSAVLWDSNGTVQLGSPLKLKLPGINSPLVGDNCTVIVNLTINSGSRVVVDYDKGEYYIDYQYLADEIIVSYEYGDNQLDFRESLALSEGEDYFVTYKVGALRDALLKNFGSLIDIPLLSVFDENFERERYRDSVKAAFSSFLEGPTVEAMKRIVSTVTHVDPEISESIFENWSLGNSLLYSNGVSVKGKPTLSKGKFSNGLLLRNKDESIELPLNSNLRIEEGTFSSWIQPRWNGLDNDAELTIIVRNNNSFVSEDKIFIGAAEQHPRYSVDEFGNSIFTISKKSKTIPVGRPNKNKDGIYIYLDRDGLGTLDGYSPDGYGFDGYVNNIEPNGKFNRWYCDVVDTTGSADYHITVVCDGQFFDAKLLYPSKAGDSISSGTDRIEYRSTQSQQGFSFLADYDHYLLDFGYPDRNRVSLFKDVGGYLNFRVIDSVGQQYRLSADVSEWKANQNHHVAVSWVLNSKNGMDEIHLFIDGSEVPNIIRYGQGFPLFYGQRFRTINPEEIVGTVNKPIVSGDNLITLAGSTLITAPVNFTAFGIVPGDTIYIDEVGFVQSGYTIVTVNGNNITVSAPMPLSLQDARYSINKISIPVKTRVDIFPNSAVYLIHPYYSADDAVVSASTLTSSSTLFTNVGAEVGNLLTVEGDDGHYVITQISYDTVTVSSPFQISGSNLKFFIYKNEEEEIPGSRALLPYYKIVKDNGSVSIVLQNGAQIGDLVRVKTFGTNFKKTQQTYYSWGADGYQGSNFIKTKLPPPVSLDDVVVRKVILPTVLISSQNSAISGDVLTYVNESVDQPVLSDEGRTLEITINGTNVDFSTPTTVTIDGYGSGGFVSEIVSFSETGKSNTLNKFLSIVSVTAVVTTIDVSKPSITLTCKEAKSMLEAELSSTVAKIQFSYQVRWGSTLSGSGTVFNDPNGLFSTIDAGNIIHIFSGPASGYYKIIDISQDHKTVTVDVSAPSFTDVIYEILNTTTERSGLQNGIMRFENALEPGSVYPITKGLYEINYPTYMSARFDRLPPKFFIGSDFNLKNQINAVVDEVMIDSIKLSDVRVGEVEDTTIGSITSRFNYLKPAKTTSSTLTLLHLDSGDVENETDIYVSNTSFLQSGRSVNANFEKSLLIKDKGILVENLGILDTKKEATIEFWVSPLIDTYNDPNFRFYFDASGAVTEEIVSNDRSKVQISGIAGKILSVKLKYGNSEKDYFGLGSIGSDRKSIILQHDLPYQNTPVVITYVPNGLRGDRVSIYKDPYGYLVFNITANEKDYQVRCPIFWTRNSWHRIKATYKLNGGKNNDEIHLFVDGFERGNVLYGTGLLFGQNVIFGQTFVGQSNIVANMKFSDPINQFTIGSDFAGKDAGSCLIDNLRISNIARNAFIAYGEPIDIGYNLNVGAAVPVTKDLFTTYLLDYDALKTKTTDFSLLKNKNSGIFDFSINIFDSFGILKDSTRTKEVLETLIKTLKPAVSRVSINYKD